MEFLDSLDFKTDKRTNRVRSWYLYEQYKSLETNQLEAAKTLKSRHYQEKLLRRELSERKARRTLFDQYDRSRTESRISGVRSIETKTSLEATNEDYLEACYQLEDQQTVHDENSVHDELSEQNSETVELAEQEECQDYAQIENRSSDFKSIVDLDDSIGSVVENLKDSENITDEIKEELEFVKHGIAENISLQLEAAKENIQCLEEYSEFCEDVKLSEREFSVNESKESTLSNFEEDIKFIVPKGEKNTAFDNNLVAVWMKLVSFAYQIIKLNHGGNCYCDYSSQFLTAVLACDVIRRGFSKMCDILQPYVCPIVFVDEKVQPSRSCYKNAIKKIYNTKKTYKASNIEPCSLQSVEQHRKNAACKCQCFKKYKSENLLNPKCQCQRYKKYTSESCANTRCKSRGYSRKYNSENYSKYSVSENRNNKKRITRCTCLEHGKTHSTLWPAELEDEKSLGRCYCFCREGVRNPMLRIAKYIDEVVHMDHSKTCF